MPALTVTDHDFDYDKLQLWLTEAAEGQPLHSCIVNAPFHFRVPSVLLYLGIVVLLLVDEPGGTINRIALSNSELADATKKMSVKRFEDIKIPLGDPHNIISQAVATGTPQDTTDWKYLFTPELTAEEARLNQAGGGIAYSAVYPIDKKGALIFSYHQYSEAIGNAQESFMQRYSQLVTDRLTHAA